MLLTCTLTRMISVWTIITVTFNFSRSLFGEDNSSYALLMHNSAPQYLEMWGEKMAEWEYLGGNSKVNQLALFDTWIFWESPVVLRVDQFWLLSKNPHLSIKKAVHFLYRQSVWSRAWSWLVGVMTDLLILIISFELFYKF